MYVSFFVSIILFNVGLTVLALIARKIFHMEPFNKEEV